MNTQKKKRQFKYSKAVKAIAVMFVVLFSLSSAVAVAQAKSVDVDTDIQLAYHEVITDEDELNRIVQEEGIILSGTKRLEKVEKIVYASKEEDTGAMNIGVVPCAILYEIKNVVVNSPDFYYTSDYDHDITHGAGSVSKTYSFTRAVKTNFGGVSIGNSTVSSAVGYDITNKYTVSKHFSATIAEGKVLDVKAYPLYRRTTFDIYNKWNNTLVKQGAYTDKPVGVYIAQYTYSA